MNSEIRRTGGFCRFSLFPYAMRQVPRLRGHKAMFHGLANDAGVNTPPPWGYLISCPAVCGGVIDFSCLFRRRLTCLLSFTGPDEPFPMTGSGRLSALHGPGNVPVFRRLLSHRSVPSPGRNAFSGKRPFSRGSVPFPGEASLFPGKHLFSQTGVPFFRVISAFSHFCQTASSASFDFLLKSAS